MANVWRDQHEYSPYELFKDTGEVHKLVPATTLSSSHPEKRQRVLGPRLDARNLTPSRTASPPASPVDAYTVPETLFLQPETRPITQEQLVNEVKGSG